MSLVKAVLRILVGVVFGLGATVALLPAFAAFIGKPGETDSTTPIVMLSVVAACGLLCFFAPNIRRAFGRGFLLLGAAIFALPLSTLLLSGRVASETIGSAEQGTEGLAAAGAGLAGMAMTGFATFIGVILGAIFLLIGLVLALGGQREVVIVERR